MLNRLRVKFVCINMIIVTMMLCIIFGTVIYFTRTNLEHQSIQMMHAAAAAPGRTNRPGTPVEQMQFPYFVVKLDKSGQVVSALSSYYDLSDEEFLSELVSIATNAESPTGVIREYGLRYSRVNTPRENSIVFADISTENSILTDLLRNCCLIGLGSFLVFLVISLLLARWAIRPVEQAWQQQRQFVADASHELKTPLTVIMTNAELLQNSDCDPTAKARFSGSILTMSRQMRGLVEGLLELARVDNGSVKTTFTELDLSTLAADTLLPFEPLFFEQGLVLEDSLDPGVRLKGSPTHLRQVLEILLDNALKYSAPACTVQVRLKKQGFHCALSVANSGDPIPPEDLHNIFKRFYRADKARSRTGSYGLGLSIAEAIVTDHRGRIWAESQNGINTFFVQLPL